jgi:hypothetical protein
MRVFYRGQWHEASALGSGDSLVYQIKNEFIPASFVSVDGSEPAAPATETKKKKKADPPSAPPVIEGDTDPPQGGTLSEPVEDPRTK